MIELVATPHGLMPAHVWKRLKDDDERRKLKHGLAGIDVSALERAAARLRTKFGADELAKAYPCRNCRTTTDDAYRTACASMSRTPCYLAASMRGCESWRPKPIVA